MTTTQPEPYTGTFSERVIAWATDRNIIGGSTPRDQFLKLVEEVGELERARDAGDRTGLMDGIGDAAVVLTILEGQYGMPTAFHKLFIIEGNNPPLLKLLGELSTAIQKNHHAEFWGGCHAMYRSLRVIAWNAGMDFDDCCEHAWNEIKDRRGRLENGVFVKEQPAEKP